MDSFVKVKCPKCSREWRVFEASIWPWVRCSNESIEGCEHRFPHPQHPGRKRILLPLIFSVLALFCWLLAITLDVVISAKFDGPETYSILEFVSKMRESGLFFSALIVQVTAVLIPGAKNTIMFFLLLFGSYSASANRSAKRWGHLLETIAKLTKHLGMVDVICIALSVVLSQGSGIIQVEAGPGSYFLLAYVVFSVLTSLAFSSSMIWGENNASQIAEDQPLASKAWGTLMPLDSAGIAISGLALVFAIGMIASAPVLIPGTYQQVHGLQPGDPIVTTSGHTIGKIGSMQTLADGKVLVTHKINPSAVNVDLLLSENTQAWIMRPSFSAGGELTGLSSITRKKVEVMLGPKGTHLGQLPTVSERPIKADIPAGSRAFQLKASSLGRVRPRSPIKDPDTGERLGMIGKIARQGDTWVFEAYAFEGVQLSSKTRFWPQDVVNFAIDDAKPILSLKPEEFLLGTILAETPETEKQDILAEKTPEFSLLEREPIMRQVPSGSLHIRLRVTKKGGATTGNPLSTRDFPDVGIIGDGSLPADLGKPIFDAYIFPKYREHIFKETKFVDVSSAKMKASLTGFELEIPALSNLVKGGIAILPPKKAGTKIEDGHIFDVSYQMPK